MPRSTSPAQRQAAVVALVLSVAAHALLLFPRSDQAISTASAAPTPRQPGLLTRTLTIEKVPAPASLLASTQPRQMPSEAMASRLTGSLPPSTPSDQVSRPEPKPLSAERTAPPEAAPATQLAPAVEWRFLLLQDGRQGLARLSWLPSPDASYQLRLDRQLEGRALPAWRSEGKVGPEGLLPDRFAQQRRGRDVQATNFRRPEGLISFSTSAEVMELPEGVQDRLSWWFQLAAMIDAAPDRYLQGSRLHMPVIGLRGEARNWAFEVIGPETLDLPDRPALPTLHLHRPQIFAYSGEIDVWLDPARRHLPVRLVYKLADERSWELLLLDEGLPP
ncbi:DUF3108 domain-containing protein [Roseateles sp.]|uniref:DUF3108 domain-containing protein n=1 Tax=Roseateles sp. TaxID=1971397 RepID=UPI003BA642EE